jgi:hypothetical protein
MHNLTTNQLSHSDPNPGLSKLVRVFRLFMSAAIVELALWQWIAYPFIVGLLIIAIPLVGFLFLFWNARKHPLVTARLSIIWLSLLLVYSIMEVLSHPIVRALAVTQGVLDVLLYFIALGVVRSALSQDMLNDANRKVLNE